MNKQTKELDMVLSNLYEIMGDGKYFLSPRIRTKILKACKDNGLVFIGARGSYGFEAEFEDIEL